MNFGSDQTTQTTRKARYSIHLGLVYKTKLQKKKQTKKKSYLKNELNRRLLIKFNGFYSYFKKKKRNIKNCENS